ncbi:MAG: hypothetical protein ACP5RS_06590 [Thermoplasmata archaeon]
MINEFEFVKFNWNVSEKIKNPDYFILSIGNYFGDYSIFIESNNNADSFLEKNGQVIKLSPKLDYNISIQNIERWCESIGINENTTKYILLIVGPNFNHLGYTTIIENLIKILDKMKIFNVYTIFLYPLHNIDDIETSVIVDSLMLLYKKTMRIFFIDQQLIEKRIVYNFGKKMDFYDVYKDIIKTIHLALIKDIMYNDNIIETYKIVDIYYLYNINKQILGNAENMLKICFYSKTSNVVVPRNASAICIYYSSNDFTEKEVRNSIDSIYKDNEKHITLKYTRKIDDNLPMQLLIALFSETIDLSYFDLAEKYKNNLTNFKHKYTYEDVKILFFKSDDSNNKNVIAVNTSISPKGGV